jgi:hypothetical protein
MKLTCDLCGYKWECNDTDALKSLNAAKVNKQGPFCGLCRHLHMAWAHWKHRPYGMNFIGAVRRFMDLKRESERMNNKLVDTD